MATKKVPLTSAIGSTQVPPAPQDRLYLPLALQLDLLPKAAAQAHPTLLRMLVQPSEAESSLAGISAITFSTSRLRPKDRGILGNATPMQNTVALAANTLRMKNSVRPSSSRPAAAAAPISLQFSSEEITANKFCI